MAVAGKGGIFGTARGVVRISVAVDDPPDLVNVQDSRTNTPPPREVAVLPLMVPSLMVGK
ncbi:hypothetical protein Holit_02943 [Hollandina sp. SP2]